MKGVDRARIQGSGGTQWLSALGGFIPVSLKHCEVALLEALRLRALILGASGLLVKLRSKTTQHDVDFGVWAGFRVFWALPLETLRFRVFWALPLETRDWPLHHTHPQG